MNEITNIAINDDFAMDTQMLKRYESNLEKAKVVMFLREFILSKGGLLFL